MRRGSPARVYSSFRFVIASMSPLIFSSAKLSAPSASPYRPIVHYAEAISQHEGIQLTAYRRERIDVVEPEVNPIRVRVSVRHGRAPMSRDCVNVNREESTPDWYGVPPAMMYAPPGVLLRMKAKMFRTVSGL
jgi:hypothetical protein